MITVDVIIPAYTLNEDKKNILNRTLSSLRNCETNNIKFNIVVFEQNHEAEIHQLANKTVFYDFEYNYNGVLNAGMRITDNDYILLSNDDVEYYPGFFEEFLKAFDAGYLSVSPNKPRTTKYSKCDKEFIEGYEIGKILCGWSICIKRELLKYIDGALDESCPHWYADNLYSLQLKRANIKHCLVVNAHAKHLVNATLQYIKDKNKYDEYRTKANKLYKQIVKEKYSDII